MATLAWQPGTLYIPGTLVRPRTTSGVVQSAPTNSDFEAGVSGWTLGSGFAIGQFGAAFNGTWSLEYDLNDPLVQVTVNTNVVPVTPGLPLNASCQIQQGGSSSGQAGGVILLNWLDASMVLVRQDLGTLINSGSGGQWKISKVSATAPPTAAFVQVGVGMFRLGGAAPVYADVFIWDYTFTTPPEGLLYRAVQALSGYSAAAEPGWPLVAGLQVVDNEVTWEAVETSSRVVYEAHPILKSGATEPDFPDALDTTVADGTIVWEAVSRQITDERCPHSKYVATAASKIFAGDDDIIPYSATNNPLDWSTKDDAGYLPFGLQTYGGNPVQGLGLYRSNLVAFNATGAQMWQVDQDPSNMALLDAVPVGCRYHKSIQPVVNDLGFLTDVGIRSFGIAAASTNLQAGDFAKAIDPLVKEAIKSGETPIGLFFPGTGQYMLFFGTDAFVLTFNGTGSRSMSRSRYIFPAPIDNWTILDGALYLRAGELVWRFDEEALQDDVHGPEPLAIGITAGFLDIGGGFQTHTGYDTHNVIGSITPDPFIIFDAGLPTFNGAQVIEFSYYTGGTDAQYELTIIPPVAVPIGDPLPTFDRLQFVGDDDQLTVLDFEDATALYDADPATEITYVWPEPTPQISNGNSYTLALYRNGEETGEDFEGYIAWPYLELQAFGDDVMLHGFDLVGIGTVDVSFGYDQSNLTFATADYTVQAETLNGMPIAMPLKAPTVQLRLTFAGNQHWSWNAARLYDSPVNT